MNQFENKLVAVLNEKIELGRLMNGLAHMCVGFGAKLGEEPLQLVDYVDADAGLHPAISKMPFIILKTNSNKIRVLRQACLIQGIKFSDFNDTMTIGTWQEQLERSATTREEALEYFGIVMFGKWDLVTELTRKFSLLK